MEIVEFDRHVSTVSIAQKTVWNHLNKARFKKKLDVWMPHELTQKNLMDRISICEGANGGQPGLTARKENRLSQFFANRDEGFYERDIMELPSKWQQVIKQNGAYLT
ncbi:hypothetical protein ALC53_01118 [Atta colombica]|uniref:Histone-lysine N-methyltransferase SETMAR n=1 Tax=Atta colombica TaxID=520822 RepID=A0A151I619_9HYME|nr:hypothetical protein ALC53_01118 [Atta colombica]